MNSNLQDLHGGQLRRNDFLPNRLIWGEAWNFGGKDISAVGGAEDAGRAKLFGLSLADGLDYDDIQVMIAQKYELTFARIY